MLLDRLIAYYGFAGMEETEFINKRIGEYTEEAQNKLFGIITAESSKRYGFPDLSKLSKAFAEVRPDGSEGDGKPARVWWAKCTVCGQEYWGDLMYCPVCHIRGNKVSEHKCVVSDIMPNFEHQVIRFNKPFRTSTNGSPSCYDCDSRIGSFCWYFGQKDFDCPRRSECACNTCCMRAME